MSRQSPGRSRTARFTYTAVRSEGGLLPYELLEAIGNLDPALGITPQAYFLAEHEPLAEAQSRAWLRLVGLWRAFQAARQGLPEGDAAVRLTRERWLLPLFAELGYGRLKAAPAIAQGGREFPVSHALGPVPIHLMGAGVDLDRPTAGVAGAAKVSPHGLVQDLLNRSDDHLWGVVTNGLRLRVLRDFHSLTRQAFLDFDLEAIFEGERFADFRLLWLVVHASRLGPAEATPGRPESAAIEGWFQKAKGEGIRALDRLREGVQRAIERLGSGFLRGPGGNPALHDALQRGRLGTQDYYRQLLRLVYRLIFVFVAEDRDVLLPELPPDAPREARAAQARYRAYYATTRIRELALRRRGGPHGDLWQALRLVLGRLYGGCPELGLPALGSYLWSPEATADLAAAELSNQDLLGALRALCTFEEGGIRRLVSWRSIGADELGSVYESFLELHPEIHRETATFTLRSAAGNERKTTGSYYTPASLVECLLDSALDPVLDRAAAQKDPEAAEAAILGLRVCDPACGSGHFLVAAGRRIAHRLAQVRAGETEPSPELMRHALRDVYARCLFGVDINPMAVELCKVSLWMEAIEPGRPLPFLDAHVQQGNALLGATPALMRVGVPDEAFKEIEGDDKEVARRLRQRNRKGQQGGLFDGGSEAVSADAPRWTPELSRRATAMEAEGDASLADIERRARRYGEYVGSEDYQNAKLLADAWCAAFVWPKDVEHEEAAPTHLLFRAMSADPDKTPLATRTTIEALNRDHNFFHWHLAFPQIFHPSKGNTTTSSPQGWDGGFDVVLGNPPWEKVKLHEKEWFAALAPEIAQMPTAAERRRAIGQLAHINPTLLQQFKAATRHQDALGHFTRTSSRYPLCAHGDLNTYAIFCELSRAIVSPTGQIGTIAPTGIAVDDTTKFFFQDIIDTQSIVSLFDFENRRQLFAHVDSRMRFCLLTLTSPFKGPKAPRFSFYTHGVEDLKNPDKTFTLSAQEISAINPNSRTCPIFRTRQDAILAKQIYTKNTPLRPTPPSEAKWRFSLSTLYHMTNDSGLFRTTENLTRDGYQRLCHLMVREGETWGPIIEGKMIDMFDHRACDVVLSAGNAHRPQQPQSNPLAYREDPFFSSTPYLWGPMSDVSKRSPDQWNRKWFFTFKRVTAATNERTLIGCVVPWAPLSYTLYTLTAEPARQHSLILLAANLYTFAADYCIRQKTTQPSLPMGVIHETAVVPPERYEESEAQAISAGNINDWVTLRMLELSYTSWDLAAFARDHGYEGPPFRWDEERRFWLRAELDAAYFHLYGLAPAEVAHVMDSFWLVRQRDEKQHGTYRTKDAILDLYARMAAAIAGGEPFETVLDPPPADPRLAHPPLTPEEAERLRPILRLGPFDGPEPPPTPTADPGAQAPPKAPKRAAKGKRAKAREAVVDTPLFGQLPAQAPAPAPAAQRPASTTPTAPASPDDAFQLTAPPAATLRLPIAAPPDAPPEPNPPPPRTTTAAPTPATHPLTATTPLPDDPEPIRHLLEAQDPDITPEVVGVLRALHRAPGPLTKGELLDQAGIDPGTWSGTIKTLLEAGLVDKEGVKRGTRYRLA